MSDSKITVKSKAYVNDCILARTLPLKQANEASLNWINNDEWRIADPGWLSRSKLCLFGTELAFEVGQ